jgi:hypothetical protein
MAVFRFIGQKAMNKIISPLDEVQDAVEDAAVRLAAVARGRLAAHRKTGDHHITIDRIRNVKYGFLDRYVSLKGTAPMSVEFGHRNHRGGYVHGLYIMTSLL